MKSRWWIAILAILVAFPASAQTYSSSSGSLNVETIARGLDHPWGLAFLPDGKMLVTERPGRLRVMTRDGKLSPPVTGVPAVRASGQGGLHDVVLDRDFASNKTVYLCYAEPASGGGRTAMTRARLSDGEAPQLDDVKVIFRQEGPLSSGNHYGCRIVQGRDGNLWLTMGDHFTYRDEAQNLSNHIGKIVRVTPDGAVPRDNPFVGRADAKPEIYSYGHRNQLGLAFHPVTGALWNAEHGPNGGDELNIIRPGANYGWPEVSLGRDYAGPWQGVFAKEGMQGPEVYWMPSIGVAGLLFYNGDKFPAWRGNAIVGSMRLGEIPNTGHMQRIVFNEKGEEIRREMFLTELRQREREVREGADGFIYILTDEAQGGLFRLEPAP